MAYDFHYTPTGTGVISGKEVLEQTEDAINDLGNTAISGVQEALDKAEQALTNSENAVDDAQTALNTANNAEGVAIQAQTDVGNLSGTVANIGNRVTTAEGNITNLQGRMTTAEGNITNLQGRMTTAESDIGNLQTAVSTAQATANSAQQTATTARQQSYVFRYSSTALVASSTNSNALLDNTDNLKVGDKVIDSSGVLFSITAIDTANSTFTIGSALIDLALDANVVHTSGDETVGGEKTFTNQITNNITNKANASIILKNSSYDPKTNGQSNAISSSFSIGFTTLTDDSFAIISTYGLPGYSMLRLTTTYFTDSENSITDSIEYRIYQNGDRSLKPRNHNNCTLGETNRRWKDCQTYLVNGITPSSLGMPVAPSSTSYVDISGYITVLDGSTPNTYTPPSNGYITFNVTGNLVQIFHDYGLQGKWSVQAGNDNRGFIPVLGGVEVKIYVTASNVDKFWFIPCQGNI